MTRPLVSVPRDDPSLLRGRDREVAELGSLLARARAGKSGALVLSGEAGIGKTALLDSVATQASPNVRVQRVVASESELELAYAGLQLLCTPMMSASGHLPAPQREALEAAFGLREAPVPNPFLVGLAVHGLLSEAAGGPTPGDRLTRHLLAWADDSGLTARELRLLLALADHEALSAGVAAGAAGRTPDAGYRAVEGLRRRDLVTEDRRRYRLTDDGAALAARRHPTPLLRPAAGRIVVGVETRPPRAALRWAATEAGVR